MGAIPDNVRIPVAALKRTGLFEARHKDERFEIELGEFTAIAAYSAESGSVGLIVRRSNSTKILAVREFEVMEKASGFGSRIYFICPQSNDFADAVYLYGSTLATRKEIATYLKGADLHALNAARLRARRDGTDGRAPARGDNRLRLDAKIQRKEAAIALRSTSLAVRDSGVLAPMGRGGTALVVAGSTFLSATRQFERQAAPLDLYEEEKGEGIPYSRINGAPRHLAVLAFPRLERWSLEELTLPLEPLSGDEALISREGHPVFRFSDFLERHKSQRGDSFSLVYVWRSDDELVVDGPVTLLVYWPGTRSRVLCLRANNQEETQYVEVLERRKGREAGFKCPVTGEWTAELYYRCGRFASLEGQLLR